MTLLHKNNKSYISRTLLVAILLICWLAGGVTVSLAQENPNIPTVKVRKKPKKVKRQKPGNNRESVRDTYKAPKTKSKPEGAKDRYTPPRTRSNDNKVRDHYKRPRSVANDEKVKVKDAHVRQSPSIEEGQEAPRPSFWQRIFRRNNPATDQGQIKVPKPSVQARQQSRQAREMANSNGPVFFKRLTHKRQIRQNEKTSDEVSRYGGKIKVRTQKHQTRFYEKQAEEIHGFDGSVKVRTPRHQTRYFKKQSKEIHQFNGLIRVRKAQKDMHPSVSYLKSKTKKSYEQKEKFRKWKIKWHRFFKGKEQPKHLKTKTRKPRYDKHESEIWYY